MPACNPLNLTSDRLSHVTQGMFGVAIGCLSYGIPLISPLLMLSYQVYHPTLDEKWIA